MNMKNMLAVSLRTAAIFAVALFLGSVSPAAAELESYGFPAVAANIGTDPVKVNLPEMPSFDSLVAQDLQSEKVRQDVEKRKLAKKTSIAALFQKYNGKLNDEKAVEYADFIMQACQKFDQDPFVIAAMVVNESSARHDAVSKGGDYGLMQVRWRVHQKKITKKYPHIATAQDMLNPQYNVLVGTEIFDTYHKTAKQDVRRALLYYSAGNERLADKIFAVLSQLEKSYIERLKSS